MRKKIGTWIMAAVLVVMSCLPTVVFAQINEKDVVEVPQLQPGEYVEGEALAVLSATQAADLAREGAAGFDPKIRVEECWNFGATDAEASERIQDYVVLLKSDVYSTKELMEIAAERNYVTTVAPNSYGHLCSANDELVPYQWYLDGTAGFQTKSTGLNYSKMPVSGLPQTVVAIVDTGVDYTNPEIADSMWINPYQDEGLKGKYGYDFAHDDEDPMDTLGHGTHCAGVVAAKTNNGTGMAGLTNAKIMSLKVVQDNSETFTISSVIAAFEYILTAQQMGVQVGAVNCSWGGSFDTGKVLQTLIDKIGENGALSVFASGNEHVDWDRLPEFQRQTPYDIDSDYLVIVGASNEKDELAAYSDYGNSQVDLLAPGSNILSLINESCFTPQVWNSEKRTRMTSYYNTVNNLAGLYTASQLGIDTDYTTTVTYDAKRGCMDQSNGSLHFVTKKERSGLWGIGKAQKESAAFLYLDVTDMNLDTSATYYISCMMGIDDGSNEMNWEIVQKKSTASASRFVTVGDSTYLKLIGISTSGSSQTEYYFDDIAVSSPNPDEKEFGKYGFMSGTSMAAPMVAAAAAILTQANPDASAIQIRRALMKCVRYVDAVENVCVTGGILDLSRVTVLASALKLNYASKTLRVGKTLQLKATITPKKVTNTKVKWTSGNKKYATVSAKGLVKAKKAGAGKTVIITATTRDGTKIKKQCKIKIIKG